MKARHLSILILAATLVAANKSYSQTVQADSSLRMNKNVIRYNLSGALLFGVDKYIVLGYERVISPRKSISVNFGTAAMPKLFSVVTDSFQTKRSGDRKGYNVSIDYRFYLTKENKFDAPHGVYIGPYYSYNHFSDELEWIHTNTTNSNVVNTNSSFNINTIGFEVGYQFIIGRHFAIDMIMVGPGIGFYKYHAKIASNVTEAQKQQLREALKQTLTQKFPGMNFVFQDQQLDADGVMKTSDIGYRYIVHIGYSF
jgi:hypothetical protein